MQLTCSVLLIRQLLEGDLVEDRALRDGGEDEDEDAEAADDQAPRFGR